MPTRGAIVDANVLIPASLCDTLLRAARVGLFRLLWSLDILKEVERNLVVDGLMNQDQARRRVTAMRSAFPQAMVEGYQEIVPSMTNETKDRHVLAAAVYASARFIVTANLSDFPDEALAPYGIRASSPDQFLVDLYRGNPDVMREVVRLQAAALKRPPLSVTDVLDGLALQTPRFVELMRG